MTPGVVVVAFGAADLLARALEPIAGLDVVVVDNSSNKEVRGVCAARGVRYVDPGQNLGFGAAVNRGVRELDRLRDVLVLNPDAVLSIGDVEALATALRAHPRRAAVAPRLVGPDGEQRPSWPWPGPGRMWREAVGLTQDRDSRDFLVGAALLLRGEALHDVGPFDERFFLYAEETDWQRRAVNRGWDVHLVVDVTAWHEGSGTSSDAARREALFHAGTETYIRKWFGAGGWLSYRVASIVGAMLRSALPGPRGAAARRRALIYGRGPRRSAGLDA